MPEPTPPKARKRFGQNFLHDTGVIDRIVRAVDPQPGERLVEIGPGMGALTLPLLEVAGSLDVIEIDRDLIPKLRERLAGHGELIIHEQDALKLDVAQLRGDGPKLRLLGNLPYNISTPILFHLLAEVEHIQDLHFMLQREVVERMAAGPGSKTYGRLSVMLARICAVSQLFRVGPGAFRPEPKVESAIVRLQPLPEPAFACGDTAVFAKVVALAFGQRRKTLRNSLRPLLEAESIIEAGVDPTQRPEQLPAEAFGRLAVKVVQLGA